MKRFIGLTLGVCLFSYAIKAQPKPLPDSIIIESSDLQCVVTFELRRYDQDKSIIRNFPSQLGDILSQVERGLTKLQQEKLHTIDVIYDDEDEAIEKYRLTIQPLEIESTTATISNKTMIELLPPGWKIYIQMKRAEIHVYAPDFERLKELTQTNLNPVITHLDNDPETIRQKRFGLIARVVLANDNVNGAETRHRLPNDMLGLHAGAGVGLVRDKLYPEFNFSLSFYLANRYKENHQRISAHYDLKLFTGRSAEGEYITQPASFLSVSYALNFRKDRPRWTGIGAGFLLHNKSDIFSGNTLKFFLETDIGSSKLNLIPELYLTNDYKDAVYGIKLTYKF